MIMTITCAFCKEKSIDCDIPSELFDGEREFAFIENFLIEQGWYVQGNEDEAYYDCGECFDEDDLEEVDELV